MVQIDFYQIGKDGLESILLLLLDKTLAANQKGLILCPMPAASEIDMALWSHNAESWIPHGLDDADGVEYCHVWVSSDKTTNPIGAKFLFLLHGSAPACWTDFTRCFYLFNGESDVQLKQARDYWKDWRKGVDKILSYYIQNGEGRWEKKA